MEGLLLLSTETQVVPGTKFEDGFGGGAPWFPSTGASLDDFCHQGKPENDLVEELFHTIQYTLLTPRQVCLYHKAYAQAVQKGMYRWDRHLAPNAEPVPTLQADEYLAMALHAWLGVDVSRDGEYTASRGNVAGETGRQQLLRNDPAAYCILAGIFRADSTWAPCSLAEPWRSFPNQPLRHDARLEALCTKVLHALETGFGPPAGFCPAKDLMWPYAEPYWEERPQVAATRQTAMPSGG